MAIEHVDITDPEIHEPKGASTAAAGRVYIANGAGSGAWGSQEAHGGWYYTDIGTGTTFASPTSYTLVNPTTTGILLHEFSHNSAGRLTYSGTLNRHVFLSCTVTLKHSTGSGQDVYLAVFKNGVIQTGSETVETSNSSDYSSITLCWNFTIVTNDYIEVYVKTTSGNVIVHAMQMNIFAVIE